MISYRFSSKDAMVKVTYVGSVFVPIVVPMVWI